MHSIQSWYKSILIVLILCLMNFSYYDGNKMGNLHVIGPDKAIVMCGKGNRKSKIVKVSGWVWAPPFIVHTRTLSLNIMTLMPECWQAETSEGVPLNVSGVAQCKIMNTPEFILLAAEQFLGKHQKEIQYSILMTLEGHLRAILGTLTVEEVFKDREKFASLVYEVASPDVGLMGIQILSFTIKDIHDDVGYLQALGKTRTAQVKRDARIGVALAERDASIREAECENEGSFVKYECFTKIEDHKRLYLLQKYEFDKAVNTAKAEANLAYELAEAILRQNIRYEETGIIITETRKEIEILEQEIECIRRELEATVKLPAEAESYRIQMIAEANKMVSIEEATGDSTKIKKLGEANSNVIKQTGLAEADGMYKKAIVYKSYGESAIKGMIRNKLPEITSQVCLPLSKIDEIVILSGDGNQLIKNMNTLLSQVPPSIKALSGIDLPKLIDKKVNKKQEK